MEYTAELDGINGYGTFFYSVFSEEEYDLVEMWVKEDLEEMGGGHADIYDEYGNFVDDVEV